MEMLSTLDLSRAGELTIAKAGWVNPVFTLSDNMRTYGRLSYGWDWRRTGKLESAKQTWLIRPQRLFRRSIIVDDPQTGQTIRITRRNIWKNIAEAEFPDGQTIDFKRNGVFSKTHTWRIGEYNNILDIESRLRSYKQPFRIIPGAGSSGNNIDLILLAFIGVHLILLQRSHAVAS
ncbi:MAG TPA: hypothetical protein VHC47_11220 [Mucilaginibacter sp.]|nr:hypothetical protein [Mucilaginibacter sp.]